MKSRYNIPLAIAALWLATVGPIGAANIWDGGGGNDNWNTPENWDNNEVPAFPVALVFDGSVRLASSNDLASKTVNGFTFNSGAGAFVVGGSAITLAGNIANSSTNLQTINLDMASTAVRTVLLGAGGGNVRLGGAISGPGGLAIAGSGSLTLSGDNRYAGDTTLGTGVTPANATLQINHANALGTGKLTLANNSGQALSIDNTCGSPLGITNNFDMPTSIAVTFAGSGDLAINGVTTLRASGPRISVSAGTLTLAKIDAASTTHGFSKSGPGTLVVTGAAGTTFQGGVRLSEGTLILGHPSALGSGTFTVDNGVVGTLQASADLGGANRIENPMGTLLGALTVSGTNSIELGGKIARTATTSDMKLNNYLPGGKLFTINDVDINLGASSRLLIVDGSGDTRANGVIANGHATTANGLTKNGTGMLTLACSNTYRGNTIINAGILAAGHSNACGTVGTITANSNGTFAVAGGTAFTRAVTFNNGSGLGGSGTFLKGGAWSLPSSFKVRPGLGTNEAGTLAVDTAGGDLAFGNNTLEIDLAGPAADRLAITGGGALNLGGTADKLVLRGHPAPGAYVIAEAPGIVGIFDQVDMSGLNRAGGRLVYQAGQVLFLIGGPGTVMEVR